MASKTSSITSENETFFSKQIKLKHKLISVTISNKHPEINVDDPEIQKFLLIFNLLLEVELNKENTEDSEDRTPDILITIATKLLGLLHNNIDSLKLPKTIKDVLKKIKSFILRGKKDGENQNDNENSAGSETSSGKARGEGESKVSSSS